jgi:hypothetical protein
LYTFPAIPILALLAAIIYINFTKAFPIVGGEYPQIASGLGITIFSTGPYFAHYY